MKKTTLLATICASLAVGIAQSNAAALLTNWTETVNFALTGYADKGTKGVRIATKDVISLINGKSITNVIYMTNTVTSTVSVTNSPYLQNQTNSYVLANYSVTIGTNNFTNHVSANFTNDINFTAASNNTATFTFANAVIVGTNGTGYLFPVLANNPATATATAAAANVFTLSGSVTSVATSNNIITVPTLDTKTLAGAKLLLMTSPLSSTNGPKWVVRTGTGRNIVNTDVSAFFTETDVMPAFNALQKTTEYVIEKITVDNRAGQSLTLQGIVTEVEGPTVNKIAYPNLEKSRKADVPGWGTTGAGALTISGTITTTGKAE